MIQEKTSAPAGFPIYLRLENFPSQSTLHDHQKLKSSSPIFDSSTENNFSSNKEKTFSECNYSEISPPVEKKDLDLQINIQNSCVSTKEKILSKGENKAQNHDLKSCQNSSNQSITEHTLENGKSKYSELAKDNIINIFTLSNDRRSNYVDDSIKREKISTPAFNQEKHYTLNNKNDNQKSSLIDKNYTTTKTLMSEKKKLDCQIKYSWQDIENWISPSQKEKINKGEKMNLECKKTYSWQILGISAQTSLHLLQNINKEKEAEKEKDNENDRYQCDIKYSWQIVGKSTQVSLNDYENHSSLNEDYWKGSILPPRENYDKWNKIKSPIKFLNPRNKTIILYSEGTQTLTDKRTQTELTDCRVKYSWENLIEKHLKSLKSSKFDASVKISYDELCVENLNTRLEPIKCSAKYSWQNLIRQRLKSKESEY